MDNCIIKTLGYNKQARIYFVDNTKMIKEICEHKNMNKLLKTALGKTVSIASLISGTLKGNQRISIKVSPSNRKHKIFADVDSRGNVRGYINDELLNTSLGDKECLSMEQLMGEKGSIQVLKDLGMNGSFIGVTDMPYRNIVDDFSHYFRQSEQIPSKFFISLVYDESNEIVLSRGIMAQVLPGAPTNLIDIIERDISDKQSILSTREKNRTMKEIPHYLFKDIEIIGTDPIQFYCECSKKNFYPMLYSLKREELVNATENNESIQMVCNVCGKKYTFHPSEIKKLI